MDLNHETRSGILVAAGALVAALTLPVYLAGNAGLAPLTALGGVLLVAWGLWQLKRSATEHVESRSRDRRGRCR